MSRSAIVAGTLLVCLSLPACTVQSLPNPARDVFTFTFSTSSELQAIVEKERQRNERVTAPYKKICIEWNEAVTVPDLLPVIEDGLRRRGVLSQIYPAGTVPASCVTLVYAASRRWEQDTAYLSYASLALRREGTVLSRVEYEPRVMDRWAGTEAKLIFLIDRLLFDSVPPVP